jgi:hypothetical protein
MRTSTIFMGRAANSAIRNFSDGPGRPYQRFPDYANCGRICQTAEPFSPIWVVGQFERPNREPVRRSRPLGYNCGMSDNKPITFDKMRPTTRLAFLCLLGLVFAIPWIMVNLFVLMPTRMRAIFAGEFIAIGAVWLAIGALQRRARADSQARDKSSASEKLSN